MTCKCPRGWCYYRADCRERPEPVLKTVDRTDEMNTLVKSGRIASSLRGRSKAAAIGYLDRAISQIESGNTTGSKRVQQIRLAQLTARRNELLEV